MAIFLIRPLFIGSISIVLGHSGSLCSLHRQHIAQWLCHIFIKVHIPTQKPWIDSWVIPKRS